MEELGELTETTVCVPILTQRKSQRIIYGTEMQGDHIMCHGMELIYRTRLHLNTYRYNFRQDVELQTAHTEYQDEGIATRNNHLKKLVRSKWGINTSTIITTALTQCYSITAYVAPVWDRYSHADILDPKLNNA